MNIVLLDKKTLGDDLDLNALNELGLLTSYETTTKKQTLERIANAQIIITNKALQLSLTQDPIPQKCPLGSVYFNGLFFTYE